MNALSPDFNTNKPVEATPQKGADRPNNASFFALPFQMSQIFCEISLGMTMAMTGQRPVYDPKGQRALPSDYYAEMLGLKK